MTDTKEYTHINKCSKKQHRRGWLRSIYYYFGYDYESDNDKPTEDAVKKKQELMKQIQLSKLRLNKIRIKPNIPFDLQKIKNDDKKVPLPLQDRSDVKTPNNSPIEKNEISQKQRYHTQRYKI